MRAESWMTDGCVALLPSVEVAMFFSKYYHIIQMTFSCFKLATMTTILTNHRTMRHNIWARGRKYFDPSTDLKLIPNCSPQYSDEKR